MRHLLRSVATAQPALRVLTRAELLLHLLLLAGALAEAVLLVLLALLPSPAHHSLTSCFFLLLRRVLHALRVEPERRAARLLLHRRLYRRRLLGLLPVKFHAVKVDDAIIRISGDVVQAEAQVAQIGLGETLRVVKQPIG